MDRGKRPTGGEDGEERPSKRRLEGLSMGSYVGCGWRTAPGPPSVAPSATSSSSGALAAGHVREVEQLRGYLEVTQATLGAAELEVETDHSQLVAADGWVAGKSSSSWFLCLFVRFLKLRRTPLTSVVIEAELETELLTLWEAADVAAGYVRARGEHLEEHLLDVPEHVRDAVEFDVHRGAAVALAIA